eukprot:TRINITY_DN55704_c0_g1_i1.p1 TRINITY_DN55704_c0_g1~~TRINITY_DN55704_c0_g1_i1.p1  ORF type:complete len:241 (+),score=49.95 TRINITY_DN55704_c0_g1_i1:188-910(+)
MKRQLVALTIASTCTQALGAGLRASRSSDASVVASRAEPSKGLEYTSRGCVKVSSLHGEVRYDGFSEMSETVCFTFCAKQKTRYFGLSEGSKCWCAGAYDGQNVNPGKCSSRCDGDDKESCGGPYAANVHLIFDCHKQTAAEVAAEAAERKAEILKSYGSFAKQTCGQADSGKTKVDGAETRVGSLEECKLACWSAPGSDQCHGFTYEEPSGKCSFHRDVLDGTPNKDDKATCYFKKIGA